MTDTLSIETADRPSVILTPIGSYISLTVPGGIDAIMANGVFIDRRNKTPMEMDAYSAYLALKALECSSKTSLQEEKRHIVEAIEARRLACGGFWQHGAWTGSSAEVHYRFTAAAIKLLVEAHADGLFPDETTLLDILKQHLSSHEELEYGTWFLHDSLERADVDLPSISDLRPNTVWGSSPRNGLVLNTHIDTLTAALYFLEKVKIDEAERHKLVDLIEKAARTLPHVLRRPSDPASRLFMAVDSLIRGSIFRLDSHRNRLSNWVKWRIFEVYFSLRRRIKRRLPFYVFADGYIERDISQIGYHFDYHIYNVHDLLRFVLLTDRQGRMDVADRQALISIVDAGIDYMCRSGYTKWIEKGLSQNGRAALVCEVILARAGLTPNFSAPEKWMRLFHSIWGKVADTPALLGFDPFILRSRTVSSDGIVFELANGDLFTVRNGPATGPTQ